MRLIAGLGNPGSKYETTRHNIGFLAIDRLVDLWGGRTPSTQHRAEASQAERAGEKVLLIKPQTYMNLSGQSVAPFYSFYKLAPEQLIVIHDELDLPPFSLQIKVGGGTGGHNGLKSIDECLGGGKSGYIRMRLGIGHPRTLGLRHQPADYVLEPFSDSELVELDSFLDQVAAAADLLIQGKVSLAMTQFNRKKV